MSVIEVQQVPFPDNLTCTFTYKDGNSSTIQPPQGGLVYLALTDAFLADSRYRNFEAENLGVAVHLDGRIRQYSPNQIPEGIRQIQARERDGLKTAVEHLIQMEGWAGNFKCTGDWNHRRSAKPIAIWLQAVLRLCERCHSYARGKGCNTPYRDGFDWFWVILRDFFSAGIAPILADLYPENVLFDRFKTLKSRSKAKGRNTTAFHDSLMNAICSMAKDLEPTNPTYPNWAFNRLLSVAFEATSTSNQERSNDFRRTAYASFLQTWRKMLAETSTKSIVVRLEDEGNSLFEQTGRGKSRKNLKAKSSGKPQGLKHTPTSSSSL